MMQYKVRYIPFTVNAKNSSFSKKASSLKQTEGFLGVESTQSIQAISIRPEYHFVIGAFQMND